MRKVDNFAGSEGFMSVDSIGELLSIFFQTASFRDNFQCGPALKQSDVISVVFFTSLPKNQNLKNALSTKRETTGWKRH